MFWKKRKKIFILCYHSVQNIDYLHSVQINIFEKQIKYLKKYFQILSYGDFSRVIEGNMMLEKNAVLVTFDDGIQDNYTNVFPLLKKFTIPCVLFLTTKFVNTISEGHKGYKLPLLRWSEIEKMVDSGLVSIQNHTHSHPLLTHINTDTIVKEISVSQELIEKKIDKKPTAIAYPKGDYNYAVVNVVKNYFKYGFTVNGGYIDLKKKLLVYEIPRILISREVSMFKFKLILSSLFWQIRSIYYYSRSMIGHDKTNNHG